MLALSDITAYLQDNLALQDALGLSDSTSAQVSPLAQGEHNANYLLSWDAKAEGALSGCSSPTTRPALDDSEEKAGSVRAHTGFACADLGNAFTKEPVSAVSSGQHNAAELRAEPPAFSSRSKAVLRVNYASQMGFSRQIGYEHHALELLAPIGRTPQPLYLDESLQLDGHGVLAMKYLEGSWIDLHNATQLEEAARILADIHTFPVLETQAWTDRFAETCPMDAAGNPAGPCKLLRPGDPLRAQFDTCMDFLKAYRSSAVADPHVVNRLEAFATAAQKQLDGEFRPEWACSIVNTEAVPSHFLLICDDQGTPTEPGHMVDWEKPIVGEAVQDVAYFLSPTTTIWDTDIIFSAAEREAFLQQYLQAAEGRLDLGPFAKRFSAYAQMNCLVGITWSANAWVEYQGTDRQLQNEKTRAKLPIYLSNEFLDQCWDLVFQKH